MHQRARRTIINALLQSAAAAAVVSLLLLLHIQVNNVDAFTIIAPDGAITTNLQYLRDVVPNSISYPAAFLAAFRTGAAISVINSPRMPSIDSDSSSATTSSTDVVGSTVLRLPSGTRVRLFYPASSSSSADNNNNNNGINCTATEEGRKMKIMAPYCTNGRQTSDGMAALVGFRQLGLSFLLGHLADASSGCIENATMIDIESDSSTANSENNDNNNPPLLIYSHGYGGNMDMATYFFRTMASKGMIVAALEHTDGTASSTVLDTGIERRFNEYLMTGRQQLTRRASELLEAAEFLPDEIERRYRGTTVGTVMLGGHSYGAPSAVMAANGAPAENSNIRGLILHDPALGMGYGMLPPNGAKSKLPAVSYVSDEYRRANVRYGDLTLHVRGAFHGNFVDAPLWAPWGLVMRPLSLVVPAAGPADPLAVHDQLAESAMAFLEGGDPLRESVMAGNLFERVDR